MNPPETCSTGGPSSCSSSALSILFTILRVEMNRTNRRSRDEAERRAGIARVSGLREVKLNAGYE